MLFNVKVENPILSGAIEAMKADEDPRKKEAVLEEILKAVFLCPCSVSAPLQENENGVLQLPEGSEVRQKMIQDKEGRPLLIAFTSQAEMDKWMEQRVIRDFVYPFGMGFLEYADLMLQKQPDGTRGPAQGFVIDPYGCNLLVDRDMVANIYVRLLKRAPEQKMPQAQPAQPVQQEQQEQPNS